MNPLRKYKANPRRLRTCAKRRSFEPNRSIRRVVTIGTPLRGSDYANDTTRWVSRRLIQLPQLMVQSGKALISQNPGLFRNAELLTSSTSIDSLSPDSPFSSLAASAQGSVGDLSQYRRHDTYEEAVQRD